MAISKSLSYLEHTASIHNDKAKKYALIYMYTEGKYSKGCVKYLARRQKSKNHSRNFVQVLKERNGCMILHYRYYFDLGSILCMIRILIAGCSLSYHQSTTTIDMLWALFPDGCKRGAALN